MLHLRVALITQSAFEGFFRHDILLYMYVCACASNIMYM